MRIHQIIPRTAVDGPGVRFCLWVQGCSRHCKGCFNPGTWNPEGGTEMTVEALREQIAATPDIEGITLLGGEPFEQAEECARLCEWARARGLSVAAFSGYTLEELRAGDAATRRLLAAVDLLMDGPYVEELQDFSRPWIGSRNQNYRFLTERYTMADVENGRRGVEIRMKKSGEIFVSGMPDAQMQRRLRALRAAYEENHR